MSKYFRLNFFCRFVWGKNGGCIYNMNAGDMIAIAEEETTLLQKAELNQKMDTETPFLQKLVNLNMGEFYDNLIFQEYTRFGAGNEISEIMKPTNQIKRIFIQLTNNCDCDCIYCDESNDIYTKTRCKKWNNQNADIIMLQWERILEEAILLGAESLCFIGGNPILEWKKLFAIVDYASQIGFKFFLIYTNMNYMNYKIIDLCRRYNVMLRAQIHFLKDCGCEGEFTDISSENVIKNIQLCTSSGIITTAEILITRYNDKAIEKMKSILFALGISYVTTEYLYDKPENEFYSMAYREKMYEKHFGEISRETITFYENHNNCLFGQISINIAGDVTPCPMMNRLVIGNVCKEPLHEIINDEVYINLTKASRSKISGCDECSYRYNCVDCRAIESAATKKMLKAEFCEVNKNIEKYREY